VDFQIMLLPSERFWAWARAGSQYAQTYGLNLTSDPVTAANYMAPGQVITFPNLGSAFPEQGDLAAWFDTNYPGIRVDPVTAETPDEFAAQLQIRLDAEDRYGQRQRPFYLLWPTKYPVITQKFGANPQIYRRFGMPGHEGLDLRALPYTDITCAADGVVHEVHANPNDHPYGIHIRIRHAFGYRTIYAHLAKTMVGWGQQVSAGDVIGKADTTGATTASHLHFSLKQDGATARKETVYPKDIIDPTPFMVWPDSSKGFDPQARPAGKCLVGASAAESGSCTDEAMQSLADSRIEALRIRAGESGDVVARLRSLIPGLLIIARLEADFSGAPVEPGAFVRQVEGDARRLAQAGVRDFEIHAQPNLQLGGWRRSWRDGDEFAKWFLRVAGRLRRLCPEARWGFPGLSPGEFVSGWREDAYRFLEQADEAVAASDWIGVICHWTNAAEMRSIQGGLAFQRYQARFPSQPLVVTEFQNGSATAGDAARADQYLSYFRMLRDEPGVIAAFAATSPVKTQGLTDGPKTVLGLSVALLDRLARRGF
jgi:murein DD-endopeptidase MepM/ murein hydrolase activator NlpD